VRLRTNATDGMLQRLRRAGDLDLTVTYFDPADDGTDIVLAQRGFALAETLAHEFGELLDEVGRDAPSRVRQLPFEEDDVGLDVDKLGLLLGVLLGESRVGCSEVPFGDEV
jgi:hypothetical protein